MPIVAALQLGGVGGSIDERLERADSAVAAAEADVVVLPEAYLPGYLHLRADAGGAARAWMGDRARRRQITLAMGYLDGDACLLGVTTPDGTHTAYRKRFLTPAEARVWRAGTEPVIVDTPAGRLGLLLCADVLQLRAWEAYVGHVDAVVVAAAWPDYAGRLSRAALPLKPALGWLYAASNPYRRDLLGRAARAVGAPVVYAAAEGPYRDAERFSGGSCVYDATGVVVAEGPIARAPLVRGRPGPQLAHPIEWSAFTAVYRLAARIV